MRLINDRGYDCEAIQAAFQGEEQISIGARRCRGNGTILHRDVR